MMNAPRILLLLAATGLAAPLMAMARDAAGRSVPAAKIRTKPVAKLARSFLPLLLIAAAGLLAIAGTAWAQQDAGSLLREQERTRELEQLEKKLPRAEEAPEKAPAAKPETGETILIKEIRYTGKIELFTEAERAGFAAEAEGQRLGIAGLQALADRITFALQQKGHLLARAVLPPQDITAGVIQITLIEGLIEKIEFIPGTGARIRDSVLQGMIQGRIAPDSLTKRDLEEALLRINDLPGVSAKARLQPGEAADTSRLVVAIEQAPRLSAVLSGDNHGSHGTGRAQANGQIGLTDLSGFGDDTRLQAVASEGMRYGRLDFGIPLYIGGPTAHLGLSTLDYENIDATGRALKLEGKAHQASAGIDYALIRTRDFTLRLGGDLNWQALTDDSITGRLRDKRVKTGALTLSGDARDGLLGGGYSNWSLAWTHGDLDLSRVAADEAADAAGLSTQGAFQRLNATLVRLQALSGDFTLYGRLSGQWANKNLDSSQDFTLGGPSGVRAWPVGEGRGDSGLLGSLELRHATPLPPDWGQLQLLAFVDAGRVRVNQDPNGVPAANACGCNSYNLAGAGLGARWQWQRFSLSGTWARTLGNNPGRSAIDDSNADGRHSRNNFWLQATTSF